jgi:IS5 family transposase
MSQIQENREGIDASAFNTSVQHIKRPRETAISGGMDQGVVTSMTTINIASRCAETLSIILDSIEIADLIEQLEFLRWTGRPGYSTRTLMGVVLTKSLYALPTWTRTLSLIREHAALRAAIGCEDDRDLPSIDAIYRFTKKLRLCEGQLQECIDAVLEALHEKKPEMGRDIAIDGSSVEAYANGQRYKYNKGPERTPDEYSDPDASWGHRSAVSTRAAGSFYGYKLHAAVDVSTDLPLAWTATTAKASESLFAMDLLDEVMERGFSVHTAALDKGYDVERTYTECEERDVRPIIPLKETTAVKRGEHRPPVCEHGTWTFAGADRKRSATKWRCPTGECQPASVWVKADRLHPLIPRETGRWKKLYCGRASVEREFGRLKNEWGLTPLRVRRLERVKLHADLTILTKLAFELAKARQS